MSEEQIVRAYTNLMREQEEQQRVLYGQMLPQLADAVEHYHTLLFEPMLFVYVYGADHRSKQTEQYAETVLASAFDVDPEIFSRARLKTEVEFINQPCLIRFRTEETILINYEQLHGFRNVMLDHMITRQEYLDYLHSFAVRRWAEEGEEPLFNPYCSGPLFNPYPPEQYAARFDRFPPLPAGFEYVPVVFVFDDVVLMLDNFNPRRFISQMSRKRKSYLEDILKHAGLKKPSRRATKKEILDVLVEKEIAARQFGQHRLIFTACTDEECSWERHSPVIHLSLGQFILDGDEAIIQELERTTRWFGLEDELYDWGRV